MLGAYRTSRCSYFFAEGDVLAFGGKGFVSEIIKIFTLGEVSHVGLVTRFDDRIVLAESTTLCNVPCLHCGKKHEGVQLTDIQARIDAYDGKVWLYPLKNFLNPAQRRFLHEFLNKQLEKPYDSTGAVESAGNLAAEVQGEINGENLDKVFCSELTAGGLRSVGLFITENASKWNPSRLIRHLRLQGLVNRRVRLK